MINGALIPSAPLRELVDAHVAGGDRYTILANVVERMGYSRESGSIVDRHLAKDAVELDFADRLLIAIDRTDAWFVELAFLTKEQALVCEDCGRPITADTGYRPLDLFRPDPDAPEGKRARAGGRRFRVYDLCRRCAGEALRQRAAKSPKVGHKGRHGVLKTSDRVPPKRGGRPRLLTDDEIRQAHVVYVRAELSLRELAERLHAAGKPGTVPGLQSALLLGFRRLALPIRPRGVAMAIARFGTDGTLTKRHRQKCSRRLPGGRRCGQFVRRELTERGSCAAAAGLCWNHATFVSGLDREQEKAA